MIAGTVYQIRDDLVQAEAVYRKALTLFQEISAAPQVERSPGSIAYATCTRLAITFNYHPYKGLTHFC